MIFVSLFVNCDDNVCDFCVSWVFFPFFYYITNHCYFIIVVSPTVVMFPLQGLYIVHIDVRVLFFPSIAMKVHRPIPDGSCLFYRTAEEILLKVDIAVPPGLQSEFHFIFDSDVQKLILFVGQTSFSVYLNW